ncbi:hypothetical protein CICLE_v10033005mg [Citrus x clementina]|uniref:DC1 domain-containing protein n=1 Tax=Citrus clementina TaxID=85681 RepID=V4VAI4_CITCL|nr:hypothetical protein CICLE_v10033005mg [Citrus x clementina]
MYRCELCNFNLHTDCMFTTSHKHHDHFKDSTFQFFTQLPKYSGSRDGYKYCEACVKPTPGFVYHCEKNGCDLHPCCFNLPIKLQILDAELELSDKELSGNLSVKIAHYAEVKKKNQHGVKPCIKNVKLPAVISATSKDPSQQQLTA